MIPLIADEPWNIIEHRAKGMAISLNSGYGLYAREDHVYASTGNETVDETLVDIARDIYTIYRNLPEETQYNYPPLAEEVHEILRQEIRQRYGSATPTVLEVLFSSFSFSGAQFTTAVAGLLLWAFEQGMVTTILDRVYTLLSAYDVCSPTPRPDFPPKRDVVESAYDIEITAQRWIHFSLLLSLHHVLLHGQYDDDTPFAWRAPLILQDMSDVLQPSEAFDTLWNLSVEDVDAHLDAALNSSPP